MDIVWEVVKWAVIGGLAFLAGRFYDQWKRIRFYATEWKVSFVKANSYGELGDTIDFAIATHAIYNFDIRAFNEKRHPIILCRLAVEFRQRKSHNSTLLLSDEKQLREKHLKDIHLPSLEWISTDVDGTIKLEDIPKLRECGSVWFVAETAEGKKKHWRVTNEVMPKSAT